MVEGIEVRLTDTLSGQTSRLSERKSTEVDARNEIQHPFVSIVLTFINKSTCMR